MKTFNDIFGNFRCEDNDLGSNNFQQFDTMVRNCQLSHNRSNDDKNCDNSIDVVIFGNSSQNLFQNSPCSSESNIRSRCRNNRCFHTNNSLT